MASFLFLRKILIQRMSFLSHRPFRSSETGDCFYTCDTNIKFVDFVCRRFEAFFCCASLWMSCRYGNNSVLERRHSFQCVWMWPISAVGSLTSSCRCFHVVASKQIFLVWDEKKFVVKLLWRGLCLSVLRVWTLHADSLLNVYLIINNSTGTKIWTVSLVSRIPFYRMLLEKRNLLKLIQKFLRYSVLFSGSAAYLL